MKRPFLMISCLLIAAVTFAQTPTASLTIFSEDGYKFFLVLNGLRQNDKAETNIRVQNLTQSFYSCKVIFEDQTLGEISKNITVNGGMDNAPGDVTYKIKAGKDGKQVLRYYSYSPITPNAAPIQPDGVAVYNSGVTTPESTTTTMTQTTTTETIGTNSNVNVNGMGVNMNVNLPNGTVVQQTTYTTTTTNSSAPSHAPASSSACNGYPMTPGDFQSARSTITQASFEESKLSTAKEIVNSNCLYAGQIEEMCRLFGFENTKLEFAKYAYKRCIDPQNYFKVNNVFDFDSSKSELSRYTGH